MSLYRSWMFVPGNQEKRLNKVKDLQADVIIYDLEDSVSVDEKETARHMVREAIQHHKNRVQFVRINDASTPFYMDDVSQLAKEGLDGIILPKADKTEDIRLLDQLLRTLEQKNNIKLNSIEIVPIIETALGIHQSYEIAKSSHRVNRLAFGSVDFALDINAQLTQEGLEILFARSQLVISSRAAGIEPPIDAVYLYIKDEEGLKKEVQRGKQLGFQGKLCIHPNQLAVVNELFSPSREDIEEAKEIVNAFEEAVNSGLAAIQVNGKMVDYPVVEKAKRIIEQAEKLGL